MAFLSTKLRPTTSIPSFHNLKRFSTYRDPNPNPLRISFLHVPEGKGGLLPTQNLPNTQADTAYDSPQIQHVGTSGVRTCVGVYFAIDSSRCFVAHINGLINRGLDEKNERLLSYHKELQEQEAAFFRSETRKRLRANAEKHGWDPVVQKSTILKSLLITCPEPRNRALSRMTEAGEVDICDENTGLWIIEGIKDFFDAPDDTIVHEKEGFVVQHPDGKPTMLSYEPEKWPEARVGGEDGMLAQMTSVRDGEPPEMECFRRVEQMRLDGWIIVKDDGWRKRY
ncbi:hypothetical protein LTR78_008836 [Recurvomyces mirabilis]|uniref:Uncharacterized protein n=1 Tax=Recurvomyces mirabilis TaxID=574656 RepID=A0AAE0WIM7_9PEZI|nr:hypothetical protein LTR78_008836 [Recurvomyces mirabilis]KAK5155751.1 hypothetical protein LTS14_005317 [Recurvomyces mirabilis]